MPHVSIGSPTSLLGTTRSASFFAAFLVPAATLVPVPTATGQCGSTADCCTPHASPGCSDDECCSLVCTADPYCCDGEWDVHCSAAATDLCDSCGDELVFVMGFGGPTVLPGGIAIDGCDLAAFDAAAGTWSVYFDGDDVGLTGMEIAGASITGDGDLLLAFESNGLIEGLEGGPAGGAFTRFDVVRFTPESLGETTSGTWAFHFDGSDVDFGGDGDFAIRALSSHPDGRLLFATRDGASLPGIGDFRGEDLVAFTPTSLGADTAGSWALFLDGSDVDLKRNNHAERLDAAFIQRDGRVLLSTRGNFSVAGTGGSKDDLFDFYPESFGGNTDGTFALRMTAEQLALPGGVDVQAAFIAPALVPGGGGGDGGGGDGDGGGGGGGVLPPDSCGDATAGDCCSVSDTPFCADATCCELVCAIDPVCCTVAWDEYCTGLAAEICEPCLPGPIAVMTFGGSVTLPGNLAVDGCDLAAFNPGSGGWSTFLDGDDVGISGQTIAGAAVLPGGDILLAFENGGTVGGLIGGPNGSSFSAYDILRFSPESLGENTAGSWSFYFDGSDVELAGDTDLRIRAMSVANDGSIIMATRGGGSLPGIGSFKPQDLVRFTATSLGATTAGSWALHFDGSDVGLSKNGEKLDAASFNADGTLMMSTKGNFNAGGFGGSRGDLFTFAASSTGSNTEGDFALYLSSGQMGLGGDIDVQGAFITILVVPSEPRPGGGGGGGGGTGTSCGDPTTGDCCVANGTPNCTDGACCTLICATDPSCCSTAWDAACAELALALCTSCGGGTDPTTCGDPDTGDCCVANGTPFCADGACCDDVCASDPRCCEIAWDTTCAELAATICIPCGSGGGGGGGGSSEDGWTELVPSADSRLVYVATDGDDGQAAFNQHGRRYYLPSDPEIGGDPQNPAQPQNIKAYRTISRAVVPIRGHRWRSETNNVDDYGGLWARPEDPTEHHPDWLLFRRGQTFPSEDYATTIGGPYVAAGNNNIVHMLIQHATSEQVGGSRGGYWGGRSDTERAVITAWGVSDSEPRPILEDILRINDVTGNIAITSIEGRIDFWTGTDPRPWDNNRTGTRNVLIEDCKGVGGGSNRNWWTDITIRRCTIVDASSADGHVQGLFLSTPDNYSSNPDEPPTWVIEECVFDRNGYKEDVNEPTTWTRTTSNDLGLGGYGTGYQPRRTYYDRNLYGATYDSLLLRGNIFSRGGGGSSVQMRSGGVAERNLFLWNPSHLAIGAGESFEAYWNSSLVKDNCFLHFDHLLPPGAHDSAIGIEANVFPVVVADNIFAKSHRTSGSYSMIRMLAKRESTKSPASPADTIVVVENDLHIDGGKEAFSILDTGDIRTLVVSGNSVYLGGQKDTNPNWHFAALMASNWPSAQGITGEPWDIGSNDYFSDASESGFRFTRIDKTQPYDLSAWQAAGFDVGSTVHPSKNALSTAAGWTDPDRSILTYMQAVDPTYVVDENVYVDDDTTGQKQANRIEVWRVLSREDQTDPHQEGAFTTADAKQIAREYHAFISFIQKARNNRKGAWDSRWTAEAVNNHIREGYGKAPISGPYTASIDDIPSYLPITP